MAPPEDMAVLKTAHTIYRQMNDYSDAMRIAIRLRDKDLILQDLTSCPEE